MSQKELLYIEDAIKHEDNMIYFLENIEVSDDLTSFIKKEIDNHYTIKEKFIKKLKECSNEWSSNIR